MPAAGCLFQRRRFAVAAAAAAAAGGPAPAAALAAAIGATLGVICGRLEWGGGGRQIRHPLSHSASRSVFDKYRYGIWGMVYGVMD